jgi:hypothetical protein
MASWKITISSPSIEVAAIRLTARAPEVWERAGLRPDRGTTEYQRLVDSVDPEFSD